MDAAEDEEEVEEVEAVVEAEGRIIDIFIIAVVCTIQCND